MRNKNFVILGDFNLCYGSAAGVYRMNNYAKAISKSGSANVYLISTANFCENEEMIQFGEGIFTFREKANIVVPSGFTQIKQNYLFAQSVNRWRKKLGKDVVFLVYPSMDFSFEFFLWFFLKFLSGQRVFVEINEVYKSTINESYINSGLIRKLFLISGIKWLFDYLRFSFSELFSSRFDGLICISSTIASYYKPYNKNIEVIPVLSDFDKTNFNYSGCKDGFKMLFTGYIRVQKENLTEFLLALADLDRTKHNWSFDLCGPLSAADERIIRDLLVRHKIESKVQILGILNYNEVLKMQRDATLLVSMRSNNKMNYYNFPTKLSEYAVSGTPILMTDTGVVSDFFRDNFNCYMVDGYKRRNFYDKLLTVLSADDSERRLIAQNAYRTAFDNFEYSRYSGVLSSFLS